VRRRENGEIMRRVMLVKPEGKRETSRPRMKWMVWRNI
jgi:hypothetical protein